MDLRKEKDREFFGPMRAKDEDALDVSGAAGTGDEGEEAGPVRSVKFAGQLKGGSEIGDDLAAPGDDDVMRRQHGKGASPGARIGDEDAAGLRDESIAAGDRGIALFEIGGCVTGISQQAA